MTEAPTQWWGTFDLPLDQRLFWDIGPLRLWVVRRTGELRVAWTRDPDPLVKHLNVAQISDAPTPDTASIQRFAFQNTPEQITLTPVLADRALVAHSETPLIVLPGEQSLIFVSSPITVALSANDNHLLEVPSFRSSDTWFGPSTGQGELCYALRTRAKLDRDAVEVYPGRAITTITTINSKTTSLAFERIKIPVYHLDLFTTTADGFWTSPLQVQAASDTQDTIVDIDDAFPVPLTEPSLVSPPRQPVARGGLRRALGALLG